MQAVWEAAGKLGCPSGLVVRMLMLTGQRLNEIAGLLSWGEIDLEQSLIAIPAARMKQSRAHEIPLCSDAKSLLQGLPRLTRRLCVQRDGRHQRLPVVDRGFHQRIRDVMISRHSTRRSPYLNAAGKSVQRVPRRIEYIPQLVEFGGVMS
jgi:integrase